MIRKCILVGEIFKDLSRWHFTRIPEARQQRQQIAHQTFTWVWWELLVASVDCSKWAKQRREWVSNNVRLHLLPMQLFNSLSSLLFMLPTVTERQVMSSITLTCPVNHFARKIIILASLVLQTFILISPLFQSTVLCALDRSGHHAPVCVSNQMDLSILIIHPVIYSTVHKFATMHLEPPGPNSCICSTYWPAFVNIASNYVRDIFLSRAGACLLGSQLAKHCQADFIVSPHYLWYLASPATTWNYPNWCSYNFLLEDSKIQKQSTKYTEYGRKSEQMYCVTHIGQPQSVIRRLRHHVWKKRQL